MATPLQPATPAGSPPPRDTDRFDNRLRFEWADPEQRVLLYSWAFAIAIAIVWLIIVGLHKMLPPTVNDEGVVITLAPPQTLTTPPAPPPVVPTKGTAATTPAPGETKAPPGRRGPERGSPKPGRPGSRTEQTTNGAGGGIQRAGVRVSAPTPIRAENINNNRRDVGELGQFVRSRESQLRFCYQEYGLKSNPSLAGTVTVAISLTGSGDVTGVNITNRTWNGPGASEAESCIRNKIESWRFPSSDAGGGTYSFPFNFTR